MVISMINIPIPTVITKTVFKFPIIGRAVMAFAGRNHIAGKISSKPKKLPNKKPKITENIPQRPIIAARADFL